MYVCIFYIVFHFCNNFLHDVKVQTYIKMYVSRKMKRTKEDRTRKEENKSKKKETKRKKVSREKEENRENFK